MGLKGGHTGPPLRAIWHRLGPCASPSTAPCRPMKSGIADYSAELLPHLAEHCEIELIVDEGFRPSGAGGALSGPWRSGRCRGCWRRGGSTPCSISSATTADYHAAIYRSLFDHPGVVVLHEYVIHHLVRELTLSAGDPAGLRRARCATPTAGRARRWRRRCVATGVPLDPWSYPLFERAVDASRGVIVHNHFTRDRVLASRPLARIATVPHHLSLEGMPEVSPDEARARARHRAGGLRRRDLRLPDRRRSAPRCCCAPSPACAGRCRRHGC